MAGAVTDQASKRARKVQLQREYLARKIARETSEEREARLARARSYSKAWHDRDPDHAKTLARAKNRRANAAKPGYVREHSAKAWAKHGTRWNADRRLKHAEDPQPVRALARARYAANSEAIRAERTASYHADIERSRAKQRARATANPERRALYSKRDYNKRRDKIRLYLAAWREANTDYVMRRYRSEPEFRIVCKLRARLTAVLRVAGAIKSSTTLDLVGCTGGDLRAHIESQFTDGMSWDMCATGAIHIDHIRTCASFDLTDPERQQACFHYTNLRPLWAADNLARPRPRRKRKPESLGAT